VDFGGAAFSVESVIVRKSIGEYIVLLQDKYLQDKPLTTLPNLNHLLNQLIGEYIVLLQDKYLLLWGGYD